MMDQTLITGPAKPPNFIVSVLAALILDHSPVQRQKYCKEKKNIAINKYSPPQNIAIASNENMDKPSYRDLRGNHRMAENKAKNLGRFLQILRAFICPTSLSNGGDKYPQTIFQMPSNFTAIVERCS